jgi:2-oxoacid:acceptor oxidoreductase delta subunit (pyruvate/2-ketoisovalerate family)
MKEKVWTELAHGCIIEKAGNAREYETGSWRTYRPIWKADACIQCLRCWIACPDSSIVLKDGKVVGIDYDHCKGCKICWFECPTDPKAIDVKLETEVTGS